MRAWHVFYGELWNGVNAIFHAGASQELVECHQAPKHAACGLAADVDAFGVDGQCICLVILERRVKGKHELYAALAAVRDVADASGEDVARLFHLIIQYIGVPVHLWCQYSPRRLNVYGLGSLCDAHVRWVWRKASLWVANLMGEFWLREKSAPACGFLVSSFAAFRHYEAHLARLNTIK